MKTFKIFPLILIVFLNFCSEKEEPKADLEEAFWVYSYHWPCDPFNDDWSPCFAIQRTAQFDFSKIIDQSETIGLEIKNFNFESGNLYKIKVKSSSKNSKELTLVEVLEKQKDYLNELLGNWQIIEVFDTTYPNEDFQNYEGFTFYSTPRMISGSNGCYLGRGIFGEIGPQSIEILIPTDPVIDICEKFIDSGKAINETVKYQLTNNILSLFNSENQIIMQLKKQP